MRPSLFVLVTTTVLLGAARADDPLPPGALARYGTERLRQGDAIAGLAFAPDGKTVVCCSASYFDPGIRLWDVRTGKATRRILPPDGKTRFTCLALSPDGKTLAAGTGGPLLDTFGEKKVTPRVSFLDVATGKERFAGEGHPYAVSTVAFSPDGKALASSSDDGTVRLWEVATGRSLAACVGKAGPTRAVTFSPDGKTLASSHGKVVRLWDVATGNLLRENDGVVGNIRKLAFSPDGRALAVGGEHDNVHVLDVASLKAVREITGHTGSVMGGLAFLADGKSLVSAARDGTVRLWDFATGKETRRYRADSDDFAHLAVNADGAAIAAGGQGGTVHLWHTATGKPLHPSPGHTGRVGVLQYSPDGKTLASGALDGTVRLWDVRTGAERKLSSTQGVWVAALAFSADGKRLMVHEEPGARVSLWDVATGKRGREFDRLDGDRAWAFAPLADLIISGGADKTVRFWSAETGKETRQLPVKYDHVRNLAVSPRGTHLLVHPNAADNERIADVWDLKKRTIVHRFGPVMNPVFSPDGDTVVEAEFDRLQFWDVATGKVARTLTVPRRPGDPDHVWGLHQPAFSPDGKYVAAGWMRSTRVFEVASGQEVGSFDAHFPVAFAPDGRAVAAVRRTAIYTWDLTGRPAAEALDRPRLEALWADVTGDDAAKAYRAAWRLAAGAKQATPFLRERLIRTAAVKDAEIERWVADLDANKPAVRKTAFDELEKLERQAEPALRRALARKPPLEPKQRMEELVAALNTPAKALNAARLTHVLEQAGGPEARAVLEALAKEAADVPLTRAARAAVRRLGRD